MRLNFDLATALRVFLVLFALLIFAGCFSSCAHNPAVFTMGKRTNIGFDPGQLTANISWTDGLNIVDVPRENSSFEIEVDEATGLTFDPGTNTVRGVRKITRKTGVQITGYLVDLAKRSPEAAAEYIRQASAINAVEPVKLSPHLVTIPLQQSNGNTVTKLTLATLKEKVAADTTETVPDGLDMTLDDWKLLKAAYIECPECLSLTDAELAALKAATGK
ncbi:MAG: hypothetical protein WCT05_16210 [Lentisphaeria bacterium]